MMKDIFLPERIGNRFLFPQTCLGLEINKSSLIATKLHFAGKNATVIDFYQEPIIKRDEESSDQSIVNALGKLIEKAKISSGITLTLSNQLAIFKELTLPFLDVDKIRQILPFELEQQIPFALSDVAFDFVVTKQHIETKQSTIFIGIVQKKDIAATLALSEQGHIKLDRMTIDLFSLYNLLQQHPTYGTHDNAMVIDIGAQATTIMYLNHGQLIGVRSMNYGISTLAKNIAEKIQKTPTVVFEQLLRFGANNIQDAAMSQALDTELAALATQLQLAFATLVSQSTQTPQIKDIILISRTVVIKGLDKQLERLLHMQTHYFNPAPLIETSVVTLDSALNTIPLVNLASLGAALASGSGQSFDLLGSYEYARAEQLLFKQLAVAAIMILVFIGTLAGYYYSQRQYCQSHLNRARDSALAYLRNEFDIRTKNLPAAVEEAQQKVDEAESIWEGFSLQNRGCFLKYLADFSTKLDKKALGLELTRLSMTKKGITMSGQVRDYQALKTLEEELSSSTLFKLISTPQEPKFEIKLAIIKVGKESA